MHLNHCALISSFLFAPIVLAGYHPEKYRPRRLLNKQNINAASDDTYTLVPWAGASLPESSLEVYNSTTGAFTVPLAWGASGNTGFAIGVSIGGMCQDNSIRFAAGIDVHLIDNVVSYAAGLEWGNKTRRPSGINITIDTGDFIRLTLNVASPTTGVAFLENLSRNQTWEEGFTEESMVCQNSAEWVVAALPGFSADMPVPMFGTVAFSNATVKTPHGTSAPSSGATVHNLDYNNTTFSTTSATDGNVVFISREMSEDDLKNLLDNIG